MSTEKKYPNCNLEFWGGIECTINRVNDRFFDQLLLSGHYARETDIQLISDLGIKVLRYPILWEKHQPEKQHPIDWKHTTQVLDKLNKHGITPIAGLLHHGSGPNFTSLLDPLFPNLFADYAREVAQKFPCINHYTPINEPLTTARFSGLYGLWFPHISNDVGFARMMLNQVKGIILAMKEIRKINPGAKLVQTEDLAKTFSTEPLMYQATFENERRWLTYDLLCGMVTSGTAMWNYFKRLGIKDEVLNFFIDNATPPDIMGFNYYITSERYLDHNYKDYPSNTHGGNELQQYADAEAIRVNHGNPFGLKVLLEEAWERYKIPVAITEAHLNSGREDQLKWLSEIINSCCEAKEMGIDIKAVTFWSLFGACGWNKLLTGQSMDYEPGAFDLRSVNPRPTAIAAFIKKIITGKTSTSIGIDPKGWWQRDNRFYKKNYHKVSSNIDHPGRPLVIAGKTGTLGNAFAKICQERNIKYVLTGRDQLDITNEKNISDFLHEQNPWAVINAAGFVKVDEAEENQKQCFEVNTIGAHLLAKACKQKNISFVSYSSDLVFDGTKIDSYCETDSVAPLNVYGASKAMAEKKILEENRSALVIRTSAFFGPWDTYNFVYSVLHSLSRNERMFAADDLIISPTYLPHLVTATLELLFDNESGIWHLANAGKLSWKQFAITIAEKAGFSRRLVAGIQNSKLNLKAHRPKNSALKSQRGNLMPSLDQAIDCFFDESIHSPKAVQTMFQ